MIRYESTNILLVESISDQRENFVASRVAPSDGHPDYAFLEAVPDLSKDTVLEVLERRVDSYGVWLNDGAAVYAAGAKAHQADHRVTLSSDPDPPNVFHWRAILLRRN